MRTLTKSIVVGLLMLAGVPLATGQASTMDKPSQLTADGNSTADRDSYVGKVRDKMRDWQQKLGGVAETMKVDGRDVGIATDSELHAAWIETRTEALKLRSATTEGWQSAKASFEKAEHELTVAWDKTQPHGK